MHGRPPHCSGSKVMRFVYFIIDKLIHFPKAAQAPRTCHSHLPITVVHVHPFQRGDPCSPTVLSPEGRRPAALATATTQLLLQLRKEIYKGQGEGAWSNLAASRAP